MRHRTRVRWCPAARSDEEHLQIVCRCGWEKCVFMAGTPRSADTKSPWISSRLTAMAQAHVEHYRWRNRIRRAWQELWGVR